MRRRATYPGCLVYLIGRNGPVRSLDLNCGFGTAPCQSRLLPTAVVAAKTPPNSSAFLNARWIAGISFARGRQELPCVGGSSTALKLWLHGWNPMRPSQYVASGTREERSSHGRREPQGRAHPAIFKPARECHGIHHPHLAAHPQPPDGSRS